MKMYIVFAITLLVASVAAAWIGFKIGEKKWRGMAAMESYQIGFVQGYSTGCSDASIPGADVIEVGSDGNVIKRTTNPKNYPLTPRNHQ